MFCPNCGKEMADESQFCPECGAAVTTNKATAGENVRVREVSSSSLKNEVFVRGYRCAGNSKYYAFTFFLPVAIALLGAFVCEGIPSIGLIIIIGAIIFACIDRKIFKQSIMYDEAQNTFVYNAHSKLKFTVKKIPVSDIQRVRVRYVKVGLMDAKYSLNDPGKYQVIALDSSDSKKSLSVWFSKKGNAEEFFPVLENVLKMNGKNVGIDKKNELLKLSDFTKESEM